MEGEPPKALATPETETYQVSRDVAGTLRKTDETTGEVELYTSIEGILQAVPKLNWDLAAAWSRLPILRVHLFIDRGSYDRGGIERSYASKVFHPEGLDLIAAVHWWRKRVKGTAGFAVFEGSFDAQVSVTDPPILLLDGTGDVEADDLDVIQRKRQGHLKRKELEKRWAGKGATEEILKKIKQADAHRMSRKAKGEEYLYKKGWVTKGSEEAPRRGLDTKETDYCFGASFCISFGMKGLILPILQQ
ncbi:unnamed protein product [Durusdinium trenchii]|uniref:Uncharacterized protein n=1 Tax=Durusdinium trenchii TaxID=1381693 RepID=A0ABP0IB19_9DINO